LDNGVVSRHRPDLEIMRALSDQQADEPFALHLQREYTVEFQCGRKQHHGPDSLAQQMLDGGRIVLVFAQCQPGLREANRVAADRMPLEHETPDEVVL
jgi:hypothetical protein